MADLIYDGVTVLKTDQQGFLRALEEVIADQLTLGRAVRVQIGSSNSDKWSTTIFVGPSTSIQFVYEGHNPPEPNQKFLVSLRESLQKFGYFKYPSRQEIALFDGQSPALEH